jgi:hypothetical protein
MPEFIGNQFRADDPEPSFAIKCNSSLISLLTVISKHFEATCGSAHRMPFRAAQMAGNGLPGHRQSSQLIFSLERRL